MDVTKTRFQDFVELEAYAGFPPIPSPPLSFTLSDIAEENLLLSDKIAQGSQWQFLAGFLGNRRKGRLYVPL